MVYPVLLICTRSSHQGWIEKRGESRNSDWKKRWAVLEEGVLWYYKTQPTEEQFVAWAAAGGVPPEDVPSKISPGKVSGLSPRRPGQARTMPKPAHVEGGVSTQGFYLLNNVIVSCEKNLLTLAGPVLDSCDAWAVKRKVLKFDNFTEAQVWLTAILRAVTHETSYKGIEDEPVDQSFKISPLAGSIQFVRFSPFTRLRELKGDTYTYDTESPMVEESRLNSWKIAYEAAGEFVDMFGASKLFASLFFLT